MSPAFFEGEAAALFVSSDKVQEPDKRDQEQESGKQGAGCAESGQFVADGGIPLVLFVYTDGNIPRRVKDAAQLVLCQEQPGAAQFMLLAHVVETDARS